MNSTLHEKNLPRKFQWYDYLIGYFPFVTIFLGLIGNPFTFIILKTYFSSGSKNVIESQRRRIFKRKIEILSKFTVYSTPFLVF